MKCCNLKSYLEVYFSVSMYSNSLKEANRINNTTSSIPNTMNVN